MLNELYIITKVDMMNPSGPELEYTLFALYPHLLYRLCNDGWWIDAIYYLHPQCVAEEMDEISGMESGLRKIDTCSG